MVILERFLPYKCVYFREVSTLQGWLLYRDVSLTGVVTLERFLPYKCVYFREVSTLQGWYQLMTGVEYKLNIVERAFITQGEFILEGALM